MTCGVGPAREICVIVVALSTNKYVSFRVTSRTLVTTTPSSSAVPPGLAQGWPNVHCSANATFGPLSVREAQRTCKRKVADWFDPAVGSQSGLTYCAARCRCQSMAGHRSTPASSAAGSSRKPTNNAGARRNASCSKVRAARSHQYAALGKAGGCGNVSSALAKDS